MFARDTVKAGKYQWFKKLKANRSNVTINRVILLQVSDSESALHTASAVLPSSGTEKHSRFQVMLKLSHRQRWNKLRSSGKGTNTTGYT